MSIEMVYVNSTDVESIGYDSDNSELHLSYIKGGLYIYSNVPQIVYEELLAAPSKGQFINMQVKKGGYPYRRG